VRTPNITLEVFRVLDSVLNPNPTAPIESDDGTAQSPTSVMASNATAATPSPANIPDVVDAKRNWSDDVTLELSKAWNAVNQQHPELRGAMLSHQVYNAFMATVGFSNRTRKAVDDKMHSMREMYRFVRLYEMQREEGEKKPAWFDLTKKERQEMRARYKIRVPNLSREVYAEIDQVMSRSSFEPDEDEHSVPPAVELLGVNPSLSLLPSTDQATEGNATALEIPSALSIPPPSPRQVSNIVAPQVIRAPQVSTVSGSLQLNGSAPSQLSNDIQEDTSHADTALTATSAEATAEPVAKRRRLQPEHDTASARERLDATTVGFLSEQLRLMHEQDREERRRQHAEQMAALREIADLLRQRP
jgi:chlorite dismutase